MAGALQTRAEFGRRGAEIEAGEQLRGTFDDIHLSGFHDTASSSKRVTYPQIWRSDRDRWHTRSLGSHRAPNMISVESIGAVQQLAQGSFHHRFATSRCHIKDTHVLRVGPLAMEATQHVAGAPKDQAREQLLPPAVTGESAGLFHQRPDHVMIIDARGTLAADSRQPLDHLPCKVDLESRLPGAAGVRGKDSRKLGHRAHRLASKTDAGRRGARRADLGSKT